MNAASPFELAIYIQCIETQAYLATTYLFAWAFEVKCMGVLIGSLSLCFFMADENIPNSPVKKI